MYFTKTFLALSFVFFFASFATAQRDLFSLPKDSTKFNNRYYKQELGIGVDQILNKVVGTSLVWKIRDDRSKLIPVTYSHFWRLQARVQSETFTGYRDSLNAPPYYFENINPAQSNTQIGMSIGRERVNFYNRINMYYGWDAGLTGGYMHSGNFQQYYVFNQNNGNFDIVPVKLTTKSYSIGTRGAAFFGLKYHFSQRISISAECALQLYYAWTKRQASATINDRETASSNSYHNFGANLNYLRFVTLNYHFKHF